MSVAPYPVPPSHAPQYFIEEGRHRWCAAVKRGRPSTLRCDVIGNGVGPALREIPVSELQIDPELQDDTAYSERLTDFLVEYWDDRKVGVLVVCPIESEVPAKYRADLKLAFNDARRNVSPLERFRTELVRGDETPMMIQRVADETGWRIGKPNSQHRTIGSVAVLKLIAKGDNGEDMLRRTLELAAIWRDHGWQKSEQRVWLEGLFVFVRNDYDRRLTSAQRAALVEMGPGPTIDQAEGKVGKKGHSSVTSVGSVGLYLGDMLRKKLRMQPPRPRSPIAA